MNQSNPPETPQDQAPDGRLDSLTSFGAEIRQLRKARRMTLADLARASGVSISHLSAIERGTVNASLRKVTRIANALGVPEEWFFVQRPGQGPMESAYVVRHRNRRNLNLLYGEPAEQSGYADGLLSSSIGGAFYMGVSDYAPYSDHFVAQDFIREGELHGFVVAGEIELRIKGEVMTLGTGDSFSRPGPIPHSIRNASAAPAQMIWVNSPVIIPKLAALDSETDQQNDRKTTPA